MLKSNLLAVGRRRSEGGDVLVLIAVFIVALFGFAALSLDVGNVYVERNRLQEAGDAAALAAVVDWARGASPSVVETRAQEFAAANGVKTGEVISVRMGAWVHATRTFVPKSSLASTDVPAVEVVNRRVVPAHFGRILGTSTINPRTVSVAIVGAATAAGGVLPWAVCNTTDIVPARCTEVSLKNDNDCTGPGNFGAMALGASSGGSDYRENIIDGYQGILRVGELHDTEPGNMVGPTSQGLNARLQGLPPYECTSSSPPPNNKRLAIIPVVETLEVSGRKKVRITGFWTFALIDSPGGGRVRAVFLDVYNGTEVDPTRPPTPGTLGTVALVK